MQIGCSNQKNKYMQNSSISNNRNFETNFTISKNDDSHLYWSFSIKNIKTSIIEYAYNGKEFVGNLQIYWIWKNNDLWIYNSDNGNYYSIEKIDGTWSMKNESPQNGKTIFYDLYN